MFIFFVVVQHTKILLSNKNENELTNCSKKSHIQLKEINVVPNDLYMLSNIKDVS